MFFVLIIFFSPAIDKRLDLAQGIWHELNDLTPAHLFVLKAEQRGLAVSIDDDKSDRFHCGAASSTTLTLPLFPAPGSESEGNLGDRYKRQATRDNRFSHYSSSLNNSVKFSQNSLDQCLN